MSRFFILIISLLLTSHLTSAKIILIPKDKLLHFNDLPANFTLVIKEGSAQFGMLYVAEPLDACSSLANSVTVKKGSIVFSPIVLIIRGGCSYEDKVRNAQKAGYIVAIVYDNEEHDFLITMSGNSSDVHIYGTFVSKASGEVLKEYVGTEVWLEPEFKITVWSNIAYSIMLLFLISLMFGAVCLDYIDGVRSVRIPSLSGGGFPRMARDLLRRIPTMVFNGVSEESSTSISCAICIEDYCIGDKLRILPCNHKFHVECVDLWLGKRRSFCPVCKRDARAISIDMPPSEETPLLTPYTG